MKKALFLSILFFGLQSFVFSQNLEKVNFDASEVYTSGLTLSQNWVTKLEMNNIEIYNGNIKNSSTMSYKDLNMSLFLVPNGFKIENNSFQGYHIAETNFAKLDGNSSLVGVNVKSNIKQTPPDGVYNPVLVLRNKGGKVLSYYVITNSLVKADQGIVYIPAQKTPDIVKNLETAKPEVLDINHDNSLSLDKDWTVEINFKEAHVNIMGGDISNWTDKKQSGVTLDVFLTDKPMDLIASNFKGVKIASANIGDIDSYNRLENTDVTAGLLNIPKNGSYYILLTLSSNDGGKQIVKTEKAFENKISF